LTWERLAPYDGFSGKVVGVGGASWRKGGIGFFWWDFWFRGVGSYVFTFGRRRWWSRRWVSGYAGVIVAHGRVSRRLGAAKIEIRNGRVTSRSGDPEDGTGRLGW